MSYMKKHAGPSSVTLHSEADLDSFVDNFEASAVGELSLYCYACQNIFATIFPSAKI